MKKNRERIFWESGGERMDEWRKEKKRVDGVIGERKRGYIETQKIHILEEDANRNFYKHVKNFSCGTQG